MLATRAPSDGSDDGAPDAARELPGDLPRRALPAPAPRRAGRGALVVARVAGRSVVTRAEAASPLKLLLPKSHGDGRWAFVATFGGGLVDGDDIDLDVRVEIGARALLGTQASTKVFRSPAHGARQRLTARVDDDALLAVVPDHLACFAGARYAQEARFELAPTASLVLLDVLSCGRAARGERWAFARYASRTRVERAGRLVALDALLLDPAHGDLARRMGRFDALATVIALGPRAGVITRVLLACAARAAPRADARPADLVVAASPLGDDGVILRAAGARIEPLTRFVRAPLAALRELFGDDPFARKW